MTVEGLNVHVLLSCDVIIDSLVQFDWAICILLKEVEGSWDQMMIGMRDLLEFIIASKEVVRIDWHEHGVKVSHLTVVKVS